MTNVTLRGIPEAQQQLNEQGHVYIPDVYDPELSVTACTEIDDLFRYVSQHRGNLGERLRNSESIKPGQNHPSIVEILGSIGVLTSEVFGRGIWPPQPGTHALLQTIDMTPLVSHTMRKGELCDPKISPVYGAWHTDRADITGLVAIATHLGTSQLEFQDGTTYDLLPGGVALLDNDRSLVHRGSSTVLRRAIGLANVFNK